VINYNSDNALPQNSINGIVFDKNGFLWLGTEMGVVRFDGKNFREYNMSNSPALVSNRCAIINQAKASRQIYIETLTANHHILTVTDDYQLKEDTLISSNPYRTHMSGNYIFSFARLYKKWAASDPGVFGGLFNCLNLNGDLFAVNDTQAYVRKDLNYYFLDEKAVSIHPLTNLTGHALKVQFTVGDVFIYVDRQNHLYAYKDGHLQNDITGSARLRKILGNIDVTGPYPIQASLKVLRDDEHSFLTYKGNIMLLGMRNGQVDFDTLAANISITNINCLHYDQQHRILYIGTSTSGLYILKKQPFQRLFFSSDNFVINSLYAQLELPDGSILTSSGILNRNNKINIPAPGIYDRSALMKSSDGHIWYSSYGWLRKTDTSLKTSAPVTFLDIWPTSIIETPDKDILFSTPAKIFRLTHRKAHAGPEGDSTILLVDTPALPTDAETLVIQLVGDNDLWVGTTAGLFSYDLGNGSLTHLPGLGRAAVRTIHKARDGNIWIGTYGQGFYRYDGQHFVKMPMDQGNNLATVHCFMEDKKGYFWLPTNKGLFRVAKKELDSYAAGQRDNVYYYYFDKSSGFASNEFNGGCTPCGIQTRDGRFSLPSLDGLIQFDPDSINVVPPDRPIFIERIAADDKEIYTADGFQVKQHAGPLIFAVSSPYFGSRANLHLEYSIPELDNKWHALNEDGKLVLTGLHKGRYTLTIRKQDGDSQYSYKTARWTILPYWYETIWFRLMAAAMAIGILLFIFWLRYRRQVLRARELEKKVAERTRELSESNRVKEKMIAIILHDLRSPLRFLHMLADHIYEDHRTMPRPQLDDMLLKFRNATLDIYAFAQDFFVWTNAQREGFVVRQEKIILREIVGEIVSLYEAGADMHQNKVLNLIPPSIVLISDSNILKLLIRNLTDNANKYTVNGEIRIEAQQDTDTARIVITDSGRSMDKERVDSILNNTYQTYDNNQGMGYKIILELLFRLGGELFIDTPGHTGNRITLIFKAAVPLTAHLQK